MSKREVFYEDCEGSSDRVSFVKNRYMKSNSPMDKFSKQLTKILREENEKKYDKKNN